MGLCVSYGKVKLDALDSVDFDRSSEVDWTYGGDLLARIDVIVQEQGSRRQARLTSLPPRHRANSLVDVYLYLTLFIRHSITAHSPRNTPHTLTMAERQRTPPRATRSAGKLPPNPPTPEQIRKMEVARTAIASKTVASASRRWKARILRHLRLERAHATAQCRSCITSES
jgi:hypothetical protein